MLLNFKFFYILVFTLAFACSNKTEEISTFKEKNLEAQLIETYMQAMEEFERGDVIFAGKKFSEAELIYPQSIWAPRAVLMSAYGYFSQGYYNDAISDIERFLIKYKNHPQTDYAYYLLALCHYDQIIDEKKDLDQILKAKKYFEIISQSYPNTVYATDASYKLDYIFELMASKEMYLARYYVEREKWIPAINRFKIVANNYDTTIYVEEALHRLVELHYKIGLEDDAKNYASLLGYNYQSSEWYDASYKIINKKYSRKKINNNTQESILKKFKNIFK